MSKSKSNLNKQVFSINPDVIIDLYELDFSHLQVNFEELSDLYGVNIGADSVYRFCPMINGTNPILWQGYSYQPLPIEAEGFEHKSDGKLARPKVRIANPDGLFSKIVHSNEDFAKCKLTRKRTFARFLDPENFQNKNLNNSGKNPFGESDARSSFPDDVFFVNSKTGENKEAIEFELVSVLELEKAYIPARVVLSGYCNWKYRCSIGCKYSGLPIETEEGLDLTKNFSHKPDREKGLLSEQIQTGYVDSTLYGAGINSIPEWSRLGKNGTRENMKGYEIGDVVKIQNKKSNNPYKSTPQVFVCIQSHTQASLRHPFFFKNFWAKDECARTIEACKKRFSSKDLLPYNQNFNSTALPYGGFPGTERFPIE